MARRRGQLTGYVHRQGKKWYLAYREDELDEDGYIRRVRRNRQIADAQKYSKREAQRIARDILAKLDQQTQQLSTVTLASFIEGPFKQEVTWALKRSGQKHYEYILGNHVIPAIGNQRLTEITGEHVQLLVKSRIEAGYSIQTAKHIRNAVSAVFTLAISKKEYHDVNPASDVRLPEMIRKESHALSFEDGRTLLAALPPTVQTMVLLSMTTSMNIAEMLGLRWKWVNLTGKTITVEAETLPHYSVAVRQNYYRGAFGSVKAKSRRRILPLAGVVVRALEDFSAKSKFNGPDDLVFTTNGTKPFDEKNIKRRTLKPIGRRLNMPWLAWHAFRHSHATFAEALEMPLSDRQAQMGHSAGNMTLHYTHSDIERRRVAVETMAGKLTGQPAIAQAVGFDTN